MWRLRQRDDGSVYLTFDKNPNQNSYTRGKWVLIGAKGLPETKSCVNINERHGSICVEDDEGNVRVLVLDK